MTIALLGATGQLGRLTLAALKARAPGAAVVALARDPARAGDLGMPVREADYNRPETLLPALAGIETVVLISGSEVGRRQAQHQAVIDAAKAAGASQILYTSILRADTTPIALGAEHKLTEEAIRASGLAFTFLRNGWYTENYTGSLGGAVAAGALIGSSGEGRLSTATRADFAEALAVVALNAAAHRGAVLELAGDTGWTMADLAAEVLKQTGKAIPFNNLPPSVYAGILKGFGLPEPVAEIIAQADEVAQGGALFDDSHTLSRLIGRPTTPLAAAVAAALG